MSGCGGVGNRRGIRGKGRERVELKGEDGKGSGGLRKGMRARVRTGGEGGGRKEGKVKAGWREC